MEGSAEESAEWGREDTDETESEEDAKNVVGAGASRKQLTETAGDQRKTTQMANMGSQQPAGATPATPPPQPPKR